MNNKPKYLNKTLSALTLAVVLLVNPSLSMAKEANVAQSGQEQSSKAAKQQMVNINKSTYEQLVTLKGVGHAKAQAIIAYRQEFGGFKSINELTKVSGIGEKIIEANKSRLSF